MQKNRWLLITIVISAGIVLIGFIMFVVGEFSRVIPVTAPTPEQIELSEKAMETIVYDNLLPGKWISLEDSSFVEFGWARSLIYSGDSNTYIYSMIKPNLNSYLIIRRMKYDTIYSIDSLTGGRRKMVNCAQVAAFENRIISLDEKTLKLASFLNDSTKVIFERVE